MRLDPTKVRRAIDDATFPATPDELAASARDRGAGEEICSYLESLGDQRYDDVDAVVAALEHQPR